ncbi:hypothetical protein, partial [Photorhabdus sp. RM323S]|uniref:hypothetical protein n=1 Tax=Photorhabdus sp. RM323S TaxID=3342828 RepID=UPI0036DD03ED
ILVFTPFNTGFLLHLITIKYHVLHLKTPKHLHFLSLPTLFYPPFSALKSCHINRFIPFLLHGF